MINGFPKMCINLCKTGVEQVQNDSSKNLDVGGTVMYLRFTIEERKSINRKTQLNEEVKPESKDKGGNNSEKHRVSKYQSFGRKY